MSTLPEKFFCIDVEAVATGRRHVDRSPCFVAVMDKHENMLLKKMIKVDKPVVSYLTPLTGFGPEDVERGENYEDVVREVKALLGPDVVLVNQSVKSDIKWMNLEWGKDYASEIELCDLFKTYNPRFGNNSAFSLAHESNVLLEEDISDKHDPEADCRATIRLFKKYYGREALLKKAKRQLLSQHPAPSWVKQNDYVWEGVCLAAHIPKKCICGAPTL